MNYFLFLFTLIISFQISAQSLNSLEKVQGDIFINPEENAIYSGCENLEKNEAWTCTTIKIKEYLKEVPLPIEYQQVCFAAKVYISFIIKEDGNIINVKLLKGFDSKIDEAALNHVKKMPKFARPGLFNGIPVKTVLTLPVTFDY